ncbi:MAG: adenylate/guanylate cyclase domain-containing protein, partial [Spirochaetota bacterium]
NVDSAIVYGTKQEITVLFVHLGLNSLNEIKKKDAMTYAKILDEYFKEIIQKIKEHQGVADLHGNNLIILFNVIKQYRHDVAALKTAEAIKKVTAELNQVLAPKGIKIEMRAGINTGFANLSSIQNGTVKYTAIGDTTSMAKILQAKAFDNEILFTEKIYDRVANIIKAKKLQPYYLNDNTAINIYALEDSTKAELRDKNQWYIKRALGKG